MFLKIWVLVSTVQLMCFPRTTARASNTTVASLICDDEMLKNVGLKLEGLEYANENLRLKLDTMNMIFNQHFMELKASTGTSAANEIGGDTSNGNDDNTNCDYSYAHLIDPRGDFPEKPECRHASAATTNSTATDATATHSAFASQPPSQPPSNCDEALRLSGRERGVHKIRVHGSKLEPFYVYCEPDHDLRIRGQKYSSGAWTIIQRRSDGSINFYRDRIDYRNGFGNLEGEFFIGLDRLHALTQSTLHELWIQLEDFEGATRWAKYSSFAIGGPSEWFALTVLGAYTGDAGDSLTPQAGQKFTTKDLDLDEHDTLNCAVEYTGAWWYSKCHQSNLNGMFLHGECPAEKFGKGIVWNTWRQYYYSLKYVHMAIRPVSQRYENKELGAIPF